MKKLVLMLAVVFSMSFFACGNKEAAAPAEEVIEETSTEVEAPACCNESEATEEGAATEGEAAETPAEEAPATEAPATAE